MADDLAADLLQASRWIDKALKIGRKAGIPEVDMAAQMLAKCVSLWLDNFENEEVVRKDIIAAIDFNLNLHRLETPEQVLAMLELQLKEELDS